MFVILQKNVSSPNGLINLFMHNADVAMFYRYYLEFGSEVFSYREVSATPAGGAEALIEDTEVESSVSFLEFGVFWRPRRRAQSININVTLIWTFNRLKPVFLTIYRCGLWIV